MGQFDFVVSPVSPDDPCGPDLEGQNDFDNALASLEGRFPQSYLKFSNPPKVSNPSEMTELAAGFNLAAELAPLAALLKRSRDIRLLVPAAKLSILAGDFGRFSEIVTATATLLVNSWEGVHPCAFEGSFAIRESHLSLLDDSPTVNMPLQEKPFITLRRLGPVSFRTQLLASKAITPRDKEIIIDEGALREALVKSDDFADIKSVHAQLNGSFEALKQIRAIFIQHAGSQNAPSFDRLNAILTPFTVYLQSIIEEREPSAPAAPPAPEEGEEAEVTPAGEAAATAAAPSAARPAAVKTLSDHAKVGSWLMGIALRAALDWLKAKERTVVPFSTLGPDQPLESLLAGRTEPEGLLDDERRRVIAEIEGLPEALRQAVMLYYYDDLTYRDLAQLLGVSTATINARLTKARALLRERLSDCRSSADDAR